ncbi:MAG TPA: HAMP domain-containing sensor histidine kinase, partial [Polyangiaceae bacterium]
AQNSLPSIEALSAARAALRHIDVGAAQLTDDLAAHRTPSARAIEEARADLARDFAAELDTENYPGEGPLISEAERALGKLDAALARLGGPVADPAAAYSSVHLAVDAADAAIDGLFELNAEHAREEITRVMVVRRTTSRSGFVIDAACVVLTAIASGVTIRAARKRREAEQAHEQLMAERTRELDMFAKRVAHDLLSPLSSLSFTLSSAQRAISKGESAKPFFERADACLRRSRKLVEGALEFARSGATHGEAVADVGDALRGAIDEARSDEGEPAEIRIESFEDVRVRCAPGVLSSVIGNLVRNALKYMGSGRERLVTLRVLRAGEKARVEVADTGPGLAPGVEGRVFEEYVRTPDDPRPGLGLGLATVRRFVEAHGGRVGVESSPQGATFWFELPIAPAP